MLLKKKDDDLDGEKENGDRWLLTYSDMITLLLALFIIMYGMSSLDSAKFQQMSAGLEAALNNPATSSQVESAAQENPELAQVYASLNKYIKENQLTDTVTLSQTNNSVIVHLKDAVLFQPNTAILLEGSGSVLKEISGIISNVYNQIDHVTITGNTADVGNRDSKGEADAWQLSVDRAVRVLNELTVYGISPQKCSIEGNSHYNPVATNETEAGRAQNRRVEIAIMKLPREAVEPAASATSNNQ